MNHSLINLALSAANSTNTMWSGFASNVEKSEMAMTSCFSNCLSCRSNCLSTSIVADPRISNGVPLAPIS